jgi:flavin reductase (DIM6/NTAB) family NADH-FMN oxidoreductase RutF
MTGSEPRSDPARYRDAVALLATGVTVVTTTTPGGPAGMTASAVCSLSLAPVALLVCISTHLPTHEALDESGSFAVNVLGEGQEALARRFATPAVDRFVGVALRDERPLPVWRTPSPRSSAGWPSAFPAATTRSSSGGWSTAITCRRRGRFCTSAARSARWSPLRVT